MMATYKHEFSFLREELEELRSRISSITEENAEWRRRLERVQQEERTRLNKEWTILENHNQLLIRENQVLMTQVQADMVCAFVSLSVFVRVSVCVNMKVS